MPPVDARRNVEEALAAAARIDPTLGAVHLFRGQCKLYLGPEWGSAGDDLGEALRRAPQDALAHLYMGLWCGMRGDRAARNAAISRAVELDPLSPFLHAIAGLSYNVSGDHDDSIALTAKGLALDPNSIPVLWVSSASLAHAGRLDEAVRHASHGAELAQRGAILLSTLGYALGKAGRRDEALAIRAELEDRAAREYIGPMATLHVDIGLGDEALIEESLRRNLEAETGPGPVSVVVPHDLDRLLDHPRLGPLVRQLSRYTGR
jgi:tetratricopeptide (TPR) repeat protein